MRTGKAGCGPAAKGVPGRARQHQVLALNTQARLLGGHLLARAFRGLAFQGALEAELSAVNSHLRHCRPCK